MVGPAESWLRLVSELGLNEAQERMSRYYGNLALISALLLTIAISLVVEIEDEAAWANATAVAGMVSFGAFVSCTIEAVMIVNTLSMCTSDQELKLYIKARRLSLFWPTMLFGLGLASGVLEFTLWTETRFERWVTLVSLGGCTASFVILSAKFVREGMFLSSLREGSKPFVREGMILSSLREGSKPTTGMM